MSYYFQAQAFDPALPEAANRSSILAANISSGNIGSDARNDIQWRRDWIARLAETEQFFNSYFDNFFRTLPPMPFTLLYTSDIRQAGEINYRDETLTVGGMGAILRYSSDWSQSVVPVLQSMQSSVQAVLDGLNATGRKEVWGLDKWPEQTSFNVQRFGSRKQTFSITVELVNSRNQVIGRQTFQAEGTYTLSVPLPGKGTQRVDISDVKENIVYFPNIKVDNITDSLTIRFATVNGASAETASRNGVLQILAVSKAEFEKYSYFNLIEGGTFMMGSPTNEAGRRSDETQHRVTVGSFYMGKYEVTQKVYQEMMGTNPSSPKGDNLPVEVGWIDAINFCNRLSQKEGLTPAYTVNGTNVAWNQNANGYRLPTEAEWEYACRAGTTTPYYSVDPDNAGWHGFNSSDFHPVGEKQPNPWGLYDMYGNVWEWCWDWYGDYSTSAQTNPTGASSGSYRVLRGGGVDFHYILRSAYRGYCDPSSGPTWRIGFRLVRP